MKQGTLRILHENHKTPNFHLNQGIKFPPDNLDNLFHVINHVVLKILRKS